MENFRIAKPSPRAARPPVSSSAWCLDKPRRTERMLRAVALEIMIRILLPRPMHHCKASLNPGEVGVVGVAMAPLFFGHRGIARAQSIGVWPPFGCPPAAKVQLGIAESNTSRARVQSDQYLMTACIKTSAKPRSSISFISFGLFHLDILGPNYLFGLCLCAYSKSSLTCFLLLYPWKSPFPVRKSRLEIPILAGLLQ